ncbi:FTR1 family protein [Candidatus Woesearchaeota archaeon]|nr:FTR1 family protein [Candidatus Woesearchaeota archaeon]
MLSEFIITFRETLEVALIVGIILSYLTKTKETKYNPVVYVGLVAGLVASVIGAILFNTLAGGFEGAAEQIFEGITMLLGAVMLTTMILWMMKQGKIAEKLEAQVAVHLSKAQRFDLFLLVFLAVLREGIETVIFLNAAAIATGGNSLLGATLGIGAAVILGYLIFVAAVRVPLKKYFTATSVLLLLFAAGLVAHGVHEFEEAGVLPPMIEHIWDINPALNPDGSYPALHEKGVVGEFMKGLFGYNGNPSLLEIFSYVTYLVVLGFAWKRIMAKKDVVVA